jgi:hypothetical protein
MIVRRIDHDRLHPNHFQVTIHLSYYNSSRNQEYRKVELGVPWLITTGSGLNDWICWHFFTITLDYSQLQQLSLNDCLTLAPFLAGLRVSSLLLWRVTNEESPATQLSWTELTSRRTEYRSLSRTVRLLLRLFAGAGTCLPNRCLAIDYSASSVAAGSCVNFVANRYLAMDHSGFQMSCKFICSLFNEVLSNSDCTASNVWKMMDNELRRCGWKRSWRKLRYCPRICLEERRNITMK